MNFVPVDMSNSRPRQAARNSGGAGTPRIFSAKKVAQLLAAAGMAELPQRLRLNLAYALTGHVELLPHLFQGPGLPSSMPKRSRRTFSSLGVSVESTVMSCSLSRVKEAASEGSEASSSGMKSPRWLSSSSPMASQGHGLLGYLSISAPYPPACPSPRRSPRRWGHGQAHEAAAWTPLLLC